MTSKIRNITLGLVVAAAALSLAPSASAQGFFGFSFGKHKRGKHIGISIGFPIGRAPAPVVHRHGSCCRQWVDGHYEIRPERVWVPATCRRVWVRPVFRRVHRHGHGRRVMVRRGYWRNERIPGYYETVDRRVWIPGHFVETCGY